MFDLSACHVERTNTQDYLVSWRLPHAGDRVTVYMSEDPDHFYVEGDPGEPLLTTTEREALVTNPDKNVRHYFYLESEHGEGVILAERILALEGTPNFRDMGGYEGEEGRKLRWGKLYRSGKLSALSDTDMHYVRRLGLTLICDLRHVLEQEMEPTLLGEEHRHQLASLPITPGSSLSFLESLQNGVIAVDDSAKFMEETNRDFVINQMPQYAEMFQLLLMGDQQMLIHCASGKDRTGFGAALILDVLGVDEDAIVEDYLLSNQYLPIDKEVQRLSQEFTDHSGEATSEHVLRPMLEVRPEYIRACFDEIRRRYQSREHFYESALRLDEAKLTELKNRYLE
jgi:protein-tyrosine phosphatase